MSYRVTTSASAGQSPHSSGYADCTFQQGEGPLGVREQRLEDDLYNSGITGYKKFRHAVKEKLCHYPSPGRIAGSLFIPRGTWAPFKRTYSGPVLIMRGEVTNEETPSAIGHS